MLNDDHLLSQQIRFPKKLQAEAGEICEIVMSRVTFSQSILELYFKLQSKQSVVNTPLLFTQYSLNLMLNHT